jgi:acyl-CoA synthetase (AMP-forming)/AMP-acid ligase II
MSRARPPLPPLPVPQLPAGAARTAGAAAGRVAQLGHVAATIVRSGVVRVPRGALGLVPLARYGTTLGGLFEMAAATAPDRVAVVDDDRAATYGELRAHTAGLAHGMAERLGLDAGDRVGLLARNHLGFVESLLAAQRLGVDVVLLNTGMSPGQAAAVARSESLRAVVVDADLLDLLAEVPADVPRVGCGAPLPVDRDRVPSWTWELRHLGGARTAAPAEDGRTVVMTSGTTGAPKGARRPASAGPDAAAAILSKIPLRADEAVHIAPPLFHTWGLANLQMAAVLRSTVVLRRRFEPADWLRTLSVHRCSVAAVVPVMLQRVLDLPEEERPPVDLSALRVVAASGSALPAGMAERWQATYGPTLYNLYGSTEVSWATIATPEDLAAAPGTAGRPPRGTRLAILDDADRPLPTGEVGRVFVGNDLQFEGYTGEGGDGGPAAKAVVDGLMATGDVGYLDADGRLFLAGRDDDMVVSGGENVYPKEVEDLLAARDDVREVAVVGVEDEEFGHRLAAFVVPRDPAAPPTAEDVRDHVRAHLARFSVPRDVVVLDELPRNPTGKVLARELRARLSPRAG